MSSKLDKNLAYEIYMIKGAPYTVVINPEQITSEQYDAAKSLRWRPESGVDGLDKIVKRLNAGWHVIALDGVLAHNCANRYVGTVTGKAQYPFYNLFNSNAPIEQLVTNIKQQFVTQDEVVEWTPFVYAAVSPYMEVTTAYLKKSGLQDFLGMNELDEHILVCEYLHRSERLLNWNVVKAGPELALEHYAACITQDSLSSNVLKLQPHNEHPDRIGGYKYGYLLDVYRKANPSLALGGDSHYDILENKRIMDIPNDITDQQVPQFITSCRFLEALQKNILLPLFGKYDITYKRKYLKNTSSMTDLDVVAEFWRREYHAIR